ncbi:hypothetical protein TNCV_1285521 [Trichonephila clavipes]|uniref:Uncharacterized protein n=1 Tax=Trichonephila clavipes TaxID=2585209 RepID=A0A8X6VEU9_TRICX|nr:hypothetical protein TNCV_1285521 [Trichonephila clavipes]
MSRSGGQSEVRPPVLMFPISKPNRISFHSKFSPAIYNNFNIPINLKRDIKVDITVWVNIDSESRALAAVCTRSNVDLRRL